jgi:O-antigen/teichoic acid export membrane protein
MEAAPPGRLGSGAQAYTHGAGVLGATLAAMSDGHRVPDEQQAQATPGPLERTVMRGARFAGGGYVFTTLATLGFALVLARLLTPVDFGHFAAGAILIGLGMLVTDSGMMAALIQRRDRLEEAAATAVLATLAAGLALALIALAISPLVGSLFRSDEVTRVTAATSGILFLRASAIVPSALLQRNFSFARRLIAEPAAAIAYGVAGIIAASNDQGVWSLVIAAYAAAVVDVGLSWGLVRWRPKLRLASFAMWRELVGYGRHVFVGTLILDVSDQVPTLIIGRLIGAGSLGLYRYATRMAFTPMGVLMSGASYVIFPALARISHEASRFRDAFLRALRSMTMLAVPGGLLLLPLGIPGAVLIFGERWRGAGEAAMALCLLAGARSIDSIVSEGLKASGRPQPLVAMHLVEGTAAAVAMLALSPLGLSAVAAGISIGALVGAVYSLSRAASELGHPPRELAAAVWPSVAAAGPACGAVLALQGLVVHAESRGTALGLALLAGEALLALAAYWALLRLIAPTHAEELRDLAGMARRLRGRTRPGEVIPAIDPIDPADPSTLVPTRP